jgi:transmembrane sensor
MSTRTDIDSEHRKAIAEAAGFWDARLRAPDCTEQDRRDFAAWRTAHPAHQHAFERLQLIVTILRHQRSRPGLRAMRDAALTAAKRQRLRLRWATGLAIVTLAATLLWILAPQITDVLNAPKTFTTKTFTTSTGQRATTTLPDGSTVDLNSQTRIDVDYSDGRRSVALLDGQAIFHVEKDPSRPFIVQAGDLEIISLGTAFDVRLDASDVRVTLLEGTVAVTQNPASAALLPPSTTDDNPKTQQQPVAAPVERASTIYLSPGQQLVVPRHPPADPATAAAPAVRETDVNKVIGWRAGRVFLDGMTLAQAVAEMNKHSTVQIVIADSELEELRVNGMFRAGDNHAFAHALEAYFPIDIERRDEHQIVLKARS